MVDIAGRLVVKYHQKLESAAEEQNTTSQALLNQLLSNPSRLSVPETPKVIVTSAVNKTIEYGFRINPDDATVFWVDGRRIRVSPENFRLMLRLAEEMGDTVPYAALASAVWNHEEWGAVSDYVEKLRRRIGDLKRRIAGGSLVLKTVRGVGVKLIITSNIDSEIRFGEWIIDLKSPYRVWRTNGEVLRLGAKRYGLLALLLQNAGRFVDYEKLLNTVWADDDQIPPTARLTEHLKHLQKLLGDSVLIEIANRQCGLRINSTQDPGIDS